MHPTPRSSSAVRSRSTAALYHWLAVGMLGLTVYGSLLPLHFTPRPLDEALEAFRQAALFDPSDLAARGDWVISSVQYAVLSFLLMAAVCVGRGRVADLVAVLVVAPVCVVVSIAIEFVQLYFPPRTVAWNDVAVETLGAVFGVVIWLAAGRPVTAWVQRLSSVTSLAGLAGRLLPAYLMALLVVQLMPFDFVVGREELTTKFAEGKIRLIPSAESADWATVGKAILNLTVFAPVGLLWALARRGRSASGTALSLGAALLIPVLIEAIQLFVYSRTFNSADIITGLAGVGAGWRLGQLVRPQSLAGWAANPRLGVAGPVLWIVWLGVVFYFNWRPFDFTTDPARFILDSDELPLLGLRHLSLAPFVEYYWGSKYNALDLFVRKALSFLPLGVLMALAQRQVYQRGAARVVLLALVISVALEVGSYFLPTGHPSVTDVLIQSAAAWLGYHFTQHVQATLRAEATLYGWQNSLPTQLHFITSFPHVSSPRRLQG